MTINAIAICPTTDAPGKRDVSRVFRPEAERFLSMHSPHGLLAPFDNRKIKAARRAEVESAIWHSFPGDWVDHVAFFCHGLRDSLQTGHRKGALGTLAQSIAWRARPGSPLVVTLYACDTARDADADRTDDTDPDEDGGEGGFADALRDALRDAGACSGWVDAHPVTAHATRAPYVRRFRLEGAEPGAWLVRPHGPAWGLWRRALWGKVPGLKDLRLRFPRMSGAEIHAALSHGG